MQGVLHACKHISLLWGTYDGVLAGALLSLATVLLPLLRAPLRPQAQELTMLQVLPTRTA